MTSDPLLRERFRDLVDEYDKLVLGGTTMRASDRAEQVRRELADLADAIGEIDGEPD